MKKLFLRYKWLGILFGILLMLAGIFVAVFGVINQGSLSLALSIVVAVICFILGSISIVIGMSGKAPLTSLFDETFAYGALLIAFGVTLIINQKIVDDIMIYTLATALLAIGTIYLLRGILGIIYKIKVGVIILNFLFATLTIAAGILVLCFQTAALSFIYVGFGILLAILGLVAIISTAKK